MHRYLRVILGILIWGGAAFAAGLLLTAPRGSEAGTASLLWRHYSARPCRFDVRFSEEVLMEVGDAVHLDAGPDPEAPPAGEVEALLDGDGRPLPLIYGWTRTVRVRFHDRQKAVLNADASARLIRVPQTGAWVLATLLNDKTLPRIAEEWNLTMLAYRDRIFALLTPIVRDLILDLEQQIEAEFPAFRQRHGAEFQALGESLKAELGGENLSALFEEVLWPIAVPRIRPILERLSSELWDKLPLWSFSWRLVYQTLPLTDNDHVTKAWMQFLDAQIFPSVKSTMDDILAAAKETAREALATDRVGAGIRKALSSLLSDPKFHALCQLFLEEVFLDNPRFQDRLKTRLHSPEVRRALDAASAHLEPALRRMGDIVLGTREDGITSEFARVLRSQILLKDLQRIVVHPGSSESPHLPEESGIKGSIEWEFER